jgi:hypothetical protein
MFISQSVKLISDNILIGIHNDVRDFDKNSIQPEIRVNRIRDNESQLYLHDPWLLLLKDVWQVH